MPKKNPHHARTNVNFIKSESSQKSIPIHPIPNYPLVQSEKSMQKQISLIAAKANANFIESQNTKPIIPKNKYPSAQKTIPIPPHPKNQ